MTTRIDTAIAKAKAYGNGSVPIPGSASHRKKAYEYSKLSLDELQKKLDVANDWLEKNGKHPKQEVVVMAVARRDLLVDAIGRKTMESLE